MSKIRWTGCMEETEVHSEFWLENTRGKALGSQYIDEMVILKWILQK
jgi:hypothetical protein